MTNWLPHRRCRAPPKSTALPHKHYIRLIINPQVLCPQLRPLPPPDFEAKFCSTSDLGQNLQSAKWTSTSTILPLSQSRLERWQLRGDGQRSLERRGSPAITPLVVEGTMSNDRIFKLAVSISVRTLPCSGLCSLPTCRSGTFPSTALV